MNEYLQRAISANVIESIGWGLVHTFWQFSAIATLAWFIDRSLQKNSARIRYLSLLSMMLLVTAAPITTWFVLTDASNIFAFGTQQTTERWDSNETPNAPPESDIALAPRFAPEAADLNAQAISRPSTTSTTTQSPSTQSWRESLATLFTPWLNTIVVVWCCGVSVFSLRPILSWLNIRRLRREGVSPAAEPVRQALQQMANRLHVKQRVEVLASSLITSPIVVGCFHSIILLPVNFIATTPIAQLEAILAHELAHVRRYDYVINLLQTLIETLFFYHPAIWWISRRMRIERENCCDDMVVEALGNKIEYGRALLAVEEFRASSAHDSLLALGAKSGSLLARVKRLVAPAHQEASRSGTYIGLFCITLALAVATSVWSYGQANGPAADEFGEESHGIRMRLVALRPDIDDDSPDLKSQQNVFENSSAMTFGIELKNSSDQGITLAGIRYGNVFAKETQGKLRTEMIAPHYFEFLFTDAEGKPIQRTHREYYQSWSVADSSSTHALAQGQSLIEVLRPAKFDSPMDFDLPPGKYKVRVKYFGPGDELVSNVQRFQPESPILKAWRHEVFSNEIEFEIRQPSRRTKFEDLVWGEPVDGLRAAVEFRVPDEAKSNPNIAPGVPLGTPIEVIFHVQNVSDKPITFVSETARQGDRVLVTNDRGETVDVKDVWYSGWPIDVAWRLEPGEIAELRLLTPSLNSIEQTGRLDVRYVIRFNSRVQKDDAGKITFPRPGDFDKEIETGIAPLWLTDAQADTQSNSATSKMIETMQPGRWRIEAAAELEIARDFVHGSDVMTSGKILLQDTQGEARYVPLSIATDFFANRMRWKAVWEEGQPVLWYATGPGEGPGRKLQPNEKVKLEELRRIDFSNPDYIQHQVFDGWDKASLPSDEIRAALENEFEIKAIGEEHHRYYESAVVGSPEITVKRLHVWVGAEGKIKVEDPAGDTNGSGELECSYDTLSETLSVVMKKFRTKTGFAVPVHAFVSCGSQTPQADLIRVLKACQANGLISPTIPIVDTETSVRSTAETQAPEKSSKAKDEGPFRLPDHWIIEDVCWVQGGNEILTVSLQGGVNVRRWDVAAKTLLSEIKLGSDVHGREIRQGTLRFSGDGKRVIGVTDAYVGVWASDTGELIKQLAIPQENWSYDTVRQLAASYDGSVIVAGLETGYSKTTLSYPTFGIAWNAVTGEVISRFQQDRGFELVDIAITPEGQQFATCGRGQQVAIWETASGKLLHDFTRFAQDWKSPQPELIKNNLINGIDLTDDGKTLGIVGTFGIRVIDVDTGKLTKTIDLPYRFNAADIQFSKDRSLLVWYGAKQDENTSESVKIFSVPDGTLRHEFVTQASVARLGNNGLVAVGESDFYEALSVWPLKGQEPLGPLPPQPYQRVDRVEENTHYDGVKAQEFVDKYQPIWGEAQSGLQYGIALTMSSNRIHAGERVRMAAFLRNNGTEPKHVAVSPDMFGNLPRITDVNGEIIPLTTKPILGKPSHYRETLDPGECFGPLYLSVGIGESPEPGRQHWEPFWETPQIGTFKLVHEISMHIAPLTVDRNTSLDSEGWTVAKASSADVAFQVVDDVEAGSVSKPLEADSPRELLRQFIDSPTIETLSTLLKTSDSPQPSVIKLLLDSRRGPNGGNGGSVKIIPTPVGNRFVVLASVYPQNESLNDFEKEQIPPEAAFVFDIEGKLVARVGGEFHRGGSRFDGDDVDVVCLGPKED
jgi:beta-lactamase regulating signal transducer with metallopeptidase domain/WD40 repeat protein